MGRFKTFRTLVVFQAVEGVTALGDRVRVERCMRPLGSTRGIVWVRVLVNGQGTHTEQFSRGRLRGADRAFAAQVARISAAPAPAAAPTRAAVAPGAERVLLDAGGVVVVMITGPAPRFEIRAPGAAPEIIPATRAWRAEQVAAIARGRQLVS